MSELEFSSDPERLDLPMIWQFLSTTYWAEGRTQEQVRFSINNSHCFAAYIDGQQIGFARVISDRLVFAYLMDVFVLPAHRGNGYALELLNHILNCPELSSVDKWMLGTQDAHPLYVKVGFKPLDPPEKWMLLDRSRSAAE